MEIKLGRNKYRCFAFDVESHNDDESIAKRQTSIWLYSFIDDESKIDDEASYGYSIEEFLDRLEKLTQSSNLYIAVYNLSFEWSFILPVILKRGFKWSESGEDGYCFNSVSNKTCASVWEARLYFGNGHVAMFRDIAKIYHGGLRNVAKHFNLPTQKGDIDYKINRLHGWKVTKEEKEYCFKDTRILIDILLEMQRRGDTLFFKSLSAASYAAANMIKAGWPNSYKPMKEFRKRYPHLPLEVDEFVRRGTSGGICYVTPRYQFKKLGKLIHIDMHQAHPTSAYLNTFPMGEPTYFKGRPPRGKICICRIKLTYSWVKLHSIISLIGREFAFDEEITIWDFELPLVKEMYQDSHIKYIDGYAFNAEFLPWRNFYKYNYEQRRIAKQQKDALATQLYKLLNNSSYGKLLEHGHDVELENVILDDGTIGSIEHPADLSDNPSPHEAKFTYLPVGSCIPAYTRVRLVSTAAKFGYENVVYFDTDSIFVVDKPETRAVLKTLNLNDELGGWGIEKDIEEGQFAAPKRYKILENDLDKDVPILTVHAAGFNSFAEEEFEAVDIVSGKYEVQGTMKVKGGTLVIMKEKEMSIQPKYQEIARRNGII